MIDRKHTVVHSNDAFVSAAGAERFSNNIAAMIGYKPMPLLKYLWMYGTPLVCSVSLKKKLLHRITLFFFLIVKLAIALYFPFKGHHDISDPEIHTSEVQQLLRLSMVGLLHWLVSGLFISSADSNRHGLQTGPTKRDPLAGQWGLAVGIFFSYSVCSFKTLQNYCWFMNPHVKKYVIY